MRDEEMADLYARMMEEAERKKGAKEKVEKVHGHMMTRKEVADHFGITRKNLSNYMSRYGINLEGAFDMLHRKKMERLGLDGYRNTEYIVQRCIEVL